jgi:hypothetical protein
MYWAATQPVKINGVDYSQGDVIPEATRLENFRTLKTQDFIVPVSNFPDDQLNWEHIEHEDSGDNGQEDEQQEWPSVEDIPKSGSWFLLPDEVGGNTQSEEEAEEALEQLIDVAESPGQVREDLEQAESESESEG